MCTRTSYFLSRQNMALASNRPPVKMLQAKTGLPGGCARMTYGGTRVLSCVVLKNADTRDVKCFRRRFQACPPAQDDCCAFRASTLPGRKLGRENSFCFFAGRSSYFLPDDVYNVRGVASRGRNGPVLVCAWAGVGRRCCYSGQ